MDVKTLTYNIPTSKKPSVFGPPTWFALHEIVETIPCDSCKDEAVSFVRFWHDLKNYEKEKKVLYKKNFIFWVNKISSLKKRTLILK